MISKKKVTISWSGGKDSAFALYKILLSGEYEVVSLHTIINRDTQRVGLHGIHERMIELQVAEIGLPLIKLYTDSSDSNTSFENVSHTFFERCRHAKIEAVVYGDIFLEELKAYRESLLKPFGIEPIFPLWQCPSLALISDFINTGFQTMICAADAKYFSRAAVGTTIDEQFVEDLPTGVDACGERGEFHTYVYFGPLFKKKVEIEKGEVVLKWYDYEVLDENKLPVKQRSSFWFQDLLPRTAL